jgi:hypothetical protein
MQDRHFITYWYTIERTLAESIKNLKMGIKFDLRRIIMAQFVSGDISSTWNNFIIRRLHTIWPVFFLVRAVGLVKGVQKGQTNEIPSWTPNSTD